MRYIIGNKENKVPEGYRTLTEEELAKEFLQLDIDKNYFISKNEWIINFVKLLAEDMETLEEAGADSIMEKIKEFSDEFDKLDIDKNKKIDFIEYKNFMINRIYISE